MPMSKIALPNKKSLTLAAAKEIAAAAEAEAVRNQWRVVIAITDDGGNLIYLQRMDETPFGSVDVAIKKARAAVAFKRPTKAFADLVSDNQTQYLSLPGTIALEGGVPLAVDDVIVGSIGVSGVKSQQDGQIAKAGAELLA
jgi:uncharacterized protein GlcG (DUF336 family)